jgi:hypothetical protein
MSSSRILLVVVALLAPLATRTLASQAHWTDSERRPVCIATGTMSSVVDSATSILWEKREREPSAILRIYSSGELELTDYLWGDQSLQSVPVMWYSASRFEPPVEDLFCGDSAQRHFGEGEERIWVIWAPVEKQDSAFFGWTPFQGYDVSYYDKMLLDIESEFGRAE